MPRDQTTADAAARRKIIAIPGHDKRLVIERVPESGMYFIRYTGGGSTPAVLQGFYTSSVNAQKAIDKWLEPKPR